MNKLVSIIVLHHEHNRYVRFVREKSRAKYMLKGKRGYLLSHALFDKKPNTVWFSCDLTRVVYKIPLGGLNNGI